MPVLQRPTIWNWDTGGILSPWRKNCLGTRIAMGINHKIRTEDVYRRERRKARCFCAEIQISEEFKIDQEGSELISWMSKVCRVVVGESHICHGLAGYYLRLGVAPWLGPWTWVYSTSLNQVCTTAFVCLLTLLLGHCSHRILGKIDADTHTILSNHSIQLQTQQHKHHSSSTAPQTYHENTITTKTWLSGMYSHNIRLQYCSTRMQIRWYSNNITIMLPQSQYRNSVHSHTLHPELNHSQQLLSVSCLDDYSKLQLRGNFQVQGSRYLCLLLRLLRHFCSILWGLPLWRRLLCRLPWGRRLRQRQGHLTAVPGACHLPSIPLGDRWDHEKWFVVPVWYPYQSLSGLLWQHRGHSWRRG